MVQAHRTIKRMAWIAALFGMAIAAGAQFTSFDATVQVRDALVVASEGVFYVAVHDQNEVWKVRADSNEVLEKIPVGKGPEALAFSQDRSMLACANSLSSSVSFIRITDGKPAFYTTVECAKGPSKLVALSGKRFAVISRFSDTLSIIDPEAGNAAPQQMKLGAAPTAIAVTEDWLVIACSMPTMVQVYSATTLKPESMIPLPSAPKSLASLRNGLVAVADATRVVLIDPRKHAVVDEAGFQARDLTTDGERIYVLEEKGVTVLDTNLGIMAQTSLDKPAASISADNGLIVLLSPRSDKWLMAKLELPTLTTPSEPAVSTHKPMMPYRRANELASAKPHQPGQVSVDSNALELSPQPFISPEANAPFMTPGAKTLSQGLYGGFSLHAEDAFKLPDFESSASSGEYETFEGTADYTHCTNLRMRTESMNFSADDFIYEKTFGRMKANGNVMVSQAPSLLTADALTYTVPPPEKTTLMLEPIMSPEDAEDQRRGKGTLEATNILVMQPTQEMFADRLNYNLANQTGDLDGARGRAGIYYFGAQKLRVLGPASFDGEDIWITTCDHDPPHYRVRVKRLTIHDGSPTYAKSAQLELGNVPTPLYWPRWGRSQDAAALPMSFDFVAGHRAHIGYFMNIGQQYTVSPELQLGLRLYPTTHSGVGFGLESDYDYTQTPSSPLFLGKGSVRSLLTTEDEGYLDLYHRQEVADNTTLLLQVEHWTGEEFYRDFFYDLYKNRTQPRSFANITYTQPTYIASGTVRVDTTDFVHETERLPEVSFHLLERELVDNLYFAFDTVDGYNKRDVDGSKGARLYNMGRLTYDLNLNEALSLTPFAELEASYYDVDYDNREDLNDGRLSATIGTTLQTRFHKAYAGAFGFSGFKHIILPSLTLSHRPTSNLDADRFPNFDAYDAANGRTRLECKLDNIVYGRDATSERVWQVARLTLTYGHDFWNELRRSDDYAAEFDIRPRAYYGWLLSGEHHDIENDWRWWGDGVPCISIAQWREHLFGLKPSIEDNPDLRWFNGNYDSLLTYLYYDNTALQGKLTARIGFAYTEAQDLVFNRDILYGAGYKLTECWSAAFEHRYDLERDKLTQQKYEIRRNLHCWEAALTFRERQSGWDVGLQFNLVAFPGSPIKF